MMLRRLAVALCLIGLWCLSVEAQAPNVRAIIFPPPQALAAFVPATTWNPLDYTGNGDTVTFSNGNRTVTRDAGGNHNLEGRSVASTSINQKIYYEYHITVSAFSWTLSIADNAPLGNDRALGANLTPPHGAAIIGNGIFLCSSSPDNNTGVIPSWGVGDNIDVALDSGLGKIWFRLNNGPWNQSQGGTQNPATGQGGASVTFAGPYFAGYGADSVAGDSLTAAFSSADWARTPPAGFGQLQ